MAARASAELRAEALRLQKKQALMASAPYFFFEPWGQQKQFLESRAKIKLLLGGNRCLAGSEKIIDAKTGLATRIDSIADDFTVHAWDGESIVTTKACKPFAKGVDRLWKIVLANGISFVASAEHYVWDGAGWTSVRSLNIKDEIPSLYPTQAGSVVETVKIESIDFHSVGLVWDFTVPKYHNYIHAGVIHHNSGKSKAGGIHDIAYCKGFWPDGSKANLPRPPVDLLVMVQDRRKHIEKIVMQNIREYCSKDWIANIKPGTDGLPEIISFDNGSRIFLGSYSQEAETHEGPAWHGVHFDEPPPRRMWVAIRRGLLDFKAKVWFTMTPLSCPWIFNELYQRADGDRIAAFNLDLLDNPHISQEEKEDFMKDLQPEEIEARVHGKFSHLSGAIFGEFKREVHVIDPIVPDPNMTTCFMSMDPHDRRPCYILWAAVNAMGEIIIYDEWPNEDFTRMKTCKMSVRDYAALIRTKEGRSPIHERTVDPNFANAPSIMTGQTLIEEFGDFGINFYPNVNNDVALGHSRIHELLRSDIGKPKLFITSNCQNMIRAFEGYIWNEKDMSADYSARERPGEYGKDMIDALRYLLDYEPTHIRGRGRFDAEEDGGRSRGRSGYG